jgi:zinc protease
MKATHSKARALVCFLTLVAPVVCAGKGANPIEEIDIPFEKFTLGNGLTVIVHEDHKAPIVAVNVWYHVGSKNEKPRKTGLAHLFEHLMFNGSENNNQDYFQALERVGSTSTNGTTSEDRTNYFETVPTSAFDLALWMESDRMGHLLGAVTQEKLDEQRGVVQNEKRQGENAPYGKVRTHLAENTYPQGHPYSWTVIGSMEDLEAASLEDAHEWFKAYYGAANAVLAIAGDVDAAEVKQKVEKYFGDIPSGPPLARQDVWVAKRAGAHRQKMHDRVPQARIYMVWNVPQWKSGDIDYLDLAGMVLGSGKNSRLYKRLVYEDQIATSVYAYARGDEIAGQFHIVATAREGIDLAKVEKAINEELGRFIRKGPSIRELRRVRTEIEADFTRRVERVGGFGGKANLLAENEVFGGDPAYYKVSFGRIREARTRDLQQAAEAWLSDGVYILEVHPFPKYEAASQGADRSKLPEVAPAPDAKFPRLQRATLANGLRIILAERHSVPLVSFDLLFDAGYSADPPGLAGTADLTAQLLDEGTATRSTMEIAESLTLLGAELSSGADLDQSSVGLSALKVNLEDSLGIFADVVLNPAFPQKEFERIQKEHLAGILQEKSNPSSMAQRVLPGILYGKDHPYGNPMGGSGTEESVRKITHDRLAQFHKTWYEPRNATLVIVGDTTMDEIRPVIEDLFKKWRPGAAPKKEIPAVEHQPTELIYLMNRPDSQQSMIYAGHIAPPRNNPDEVAIDAMNTVLGGSFTSRVNMNLREEKHWTYGADTALYGARGQRPFLASASVQTDKTREAMEEIRKEFLGILGDRPPTQEEVDKVRKNETFRLAAAWETIGAVASSIGALVRYGLPDNYYDTYPDEVRALTIAGVADAAKKVIRTDRMVWVVVGDLAKIEKDIRDLGRGEVRVIDVEGSPAE